jgi:hypothetical protein
VVPPERRTRSYYFKRALLRGQNERLLLNVRSVSKSIAAVSLYVIVLPFASVCGQHIAMRLGVRMFDHVGKLLAALGVSPIRAKYLNG